MTRGIAYIDICSVKSFDLSAFAELFTVDFLYVVPSVETKKIMFIQSSLVFNFTTPCLSIQRPFGNVVPRCNDCDHFVFIIINVIR